MYKAKWHLFLRLLPVVYLLTMGANLLRAQTITSAISGTVIDDSGAVVPGATVTLTGEGTGVARTSTTNATGVFIFESVQYGVYTIKIEKAGFKTYTRAGQNLSANERLALGDITLPVGSVGQTLDVTAQGQHVELESTEQSGLLTSMELSMMVARGRDPVNLLKTLPGVALITVNASIGEQPESSLGGGDQVLGQSWGSFTGAMQGSRSWWNNLLLDGQVTSDEDNVGANTAPVPMEAIAEIKALTANYPAEYGRNQGPVVNFVTKSGTQVYHGEVYFFKRSDEFNANDYFANRDGLGKLPFRFTTVGGNIGGPIYIPGKWNTHKDKLFVFYSQENWRGVMGGSPTTVTMPTALERAGDFSQSLDSSGNLIVVTDPLTGKPFPGNIIPPDRINPNGAKFLTVFQLPNETNRSITGGAYNYVWSDTLKVPRASEVTRIDIHASEKDSVWLRGQRWAQDSQGCNVAAGLCANTPIAPHWHYRWSTLYEQTGWTHVFSSTMVNELQGGIRGVREQAPIQAESQIAPMLKSTYGITQQQLYPQYNPHDFIPWMSFGGVPNAGAISFDSRAPINAGHLRLSSSDNFSWVKGNHNPKFGYYWEWVAYSMGPRANPSTSQSGSYSFARDPYNPGDTGYAYANALLGNFDNYNESDGLTDSRLRKSSFEWFAQDSWKVTKRLNVNYGVRWSTSHPWTARPLTGDAADFALSRFDPSQVPTFYIPAINPANGQRMAENPITDQFYPVSWIGAFVPGTGNVTNGAVVAKDTSYPDGFYYNPGVRWGPRLGIAYDPTGHGTTAIRAAFDITNQMYDTGNGFMWEGSAVPPITFMPQIQFGNMDTLLESQSLMYPSPTASQELHRTDPYLMSWTLGVQHQFSSNMLLDVSYVGNAGRHLYQIRNINEIPYGAHFLPQNQDPTTGTSLPDDFLRPYRGWGEIDYYEAAGSSNFNALEATLNRRFSTGLQAGVTYTYSKAMDTGSNDQGFVPTYASIHQWMYGPSIFDQTHMLSANYLYPLPKVSKHWSNLFTRSVLDQWTLSGISTFSSGVPFMPSFLTTDNADITGGGDGARMVMIARPQLPHGDRTADRWFNTAAFARPAQGTIGNMANNVIRGPGLNNWDIALSKNIPVFSEKRYFQFRAEFFNAWNHTQFQFLDTLAIFDPQGDQTNGDFGKTTGARLPRMIELSLKFAF